MRWLAALVLAVIAGCGQTGPLVLPGAAGSQDVPAASPQENDGAASQEQDEENDR
jgi:predicted small lipoprotein YifL